MAKPRFTMIVLLIADLPRSLAFYRRLGMEFPADAAGWRTAQVPMSEFIPSRPEVHTTLHDRTLSLILPNTIQRNVGLEIAALAIETP